MTATNQSPTPTSDQDGRNDENGAHPDGAAPACPSLPGPFEWSAFGASYPDTSCENGTCLDLDSLSTAAGIPCPFCRPVDFFDYHWGESGLEPTCASCSTRLTSQGLVFHDGAALTWSVWCTTCDRRQPARMRSCSLGDDTDTGPSADEPRPLSSIAETVARGEA